MSRNPIDATLALARMLTPRPPALPPLQLGMQYGEESQQEASVQFQPSSEVWAQLEKMTEQVKEFAGVDLDDALALLYASKVCVCAHATPPPPPLPL